MRILVVVPFYKPAFSFGGPTRSVPALAEGLAELGHTVRVMTTNATPNGTLDVDTGVERDVSGVGVTYFRTYRIASRFFISPGLRRRIRSTAPDFDVAYVYGIWIHPAIAAGAACRRHEVPYVVSPRTGLMDWPMRRRSLLKKVYLRVFGSQYLRGSAAIHYTTEKERLESAGRAAGTTGFVVPNPVDLSEFDDALAAYESDRAWLAPEAVSGTDTGGKSLTEGANSTSLTVLFLGRLEPRKGLGLTLHAFASVADDFPEARLVIAGPSYRGHRQELEDEVAELKLGDRVRFTGYLDSGQRIRALNAADVFVLTSWTENFAVAAVEAMAMATPVLLTTGVGVAPDAADAGAALVVEPDVTEVRRGLEKLLSDAGARRTMAERAQRHVQMYRPARVARQMADKFRLILNKGGRDARPAPAGRSRG